MSCWKGVIALLLALPAPLAAEAPFPQDPYVTLTAATGEPSTVDPYVRLAQAPGFPANNPLGAATPRPTESILPPGTRDGFFQKANLFATWMPQLEEDSVGVTGFDMNLVFGMPFPKRESPLLITPAYRVRFLDGPNFVDVPPRVHDAEVDFHHFRQLTDRWLFDGAVTLGMYADDHSFDTDDAFRISGRALGVYDFCCSDWKAVLGVVYLNRAGYSVIPAVGFTYDQGDYKLDLLFPRPRVAWRLPGCVRPGYDERWVYLQGEFGGNRWAVQRVGGATDTLAYSDLRVMLGYERKLVGGVSRRWEVGYAFNRELEYETAATEFNLDDSLFLRGGLTY